MTGPPAAALMRHEPAGDYSSNRLFEWVMAGCMLMIALTLALPGDTLERGALKMLADAGADEMWLAVAFATIGTLRCFALFANGKLPIYGPMARYIGSMAGALAWVSIMLPLALDSLITGKPSLVAPIFGMLTLGELISCYRAVRDSGIRRR